MPDILMVVPTYNELENIQKLVPMLLDLPLDLGVIVVDDHSPDGTGEAADQLASAYSGRVQVIHRAGKLGLGTAYIAGFKAALAQDANRILSMDADFSHHPRYIPDMVAKIDEGYDLVIGSRYVTGGSMPDFPLPRIILSGGSNFVARTLLGLHAKDATAGFRCYRRAVLEALPLDSIFSSGYSFLVEMLFLVQRAGFRIGEIPITFMDRAAGTTKISRQEIYKAIYTVFRLFARRILGPGRTQPTKS
jgi:dolichol-phosphate mannosyltransferase